MFNITIRLSIRDWELQEYNVEANEIVSAYVSAIRAVKRWLHIEDVDFLPLGDNQYIIWAEKKCQGFMSIQPVDVTSIVNDSGNGQ